MKKVACVGILVADVIVQPVAKMPEKGALEKVNSITIHSGGNAMTASINLTKLGTEAYIIGKVGGDVFGGYLRDCLANAGVSVKGLKTDNSVQTSASVLLIDAAAERSYFHCVGTNAVFSIDDIDWSIIEDCDSVFVTGTFLLNTFDGAQTAEFLKRCKAMGKTTFLDVCHDASGKWGEIVNPCLPYLDYFMPSIDEAKCIAKKDDVQAMADEFIKNGAKNIVIKMGGDGCFYQPYGESAGKIVPAFKGIKAVDTTGAGDSFCSGFLAAHSRDLSMEECVRFANATGAHCVMEKGATTGIKSYDEIMAFINERI